MRLCPALLVNENRRMNKLRLSLQLECELGGRKRNARVDVQTQRFGSGETEEAEPFGA